MSEFYQPGQHPDADQLSAFAEDALPAHERQQTLSHLAACTDCRMIVSLALPPVEDVPQLQPATARRPWFYGWNMAWPAGAALAALIFLTVHIRNSSRDGKAVIAPTQTAEVHTAAPAEQIATSAAPMAARKKVPTVAVPRIADSVEAMKTPATGATMNNQQIARLPVEGRRFIAQPQQQQLTQQQQQQAEALRGNAFGAAAGAGLPGGIAQVDRSPDSLHGASKQGAAGAVAAMPPPLAAAPVMSARMQRAPGPLAEAPKAAPQASEAVTVAGANAQVETTNASVSMTLANLGNIDARRLPSHLAIASTITRGNEMLALDAAGALFLSKDGGRHWKAIAAQWPGRAVKIELASLPVPPAKQPMKVYVDGNASASDVGSLGAEADSRVSVGGVVTDPTGAIIPNVSINVTDTRTRIVRATVSDHSGHYAVGRLTPDTYQIDASASGFQSWRGAVTVAAAQQRVVNISLRVGAVDETVEVSSQPTIMFDKVTTKARSDAKTTALNEPSAAFQITTDNGEIWTSADGKSWKRK